MPNNEVTIMKTADELRDEARALRAERADADVRRAMRVPSAAEEIADLDRRITELETRHREVSARAQVLRNEAQVEANERAQAERRRIDEAIRYTEGIEREFRRLLAETGWYLTSAQGRERCEQRALATLQLVYGEGAGEGAVEHCRRHVLPTLSPAASAGVGGR